jgi:hypothetical protein
MACSGLHKTDAHILVDKTEAQKCSFCERLSPAHIRIQVQRVPCMEMVHVQGQKCTTAESRI